jgi:hypothetical protein
MSAQARGVVCEAKRCRQRRGRPLADERVCRRAKRSHAAVRALYERPSPRRGVPGEAVSDAAAAHQQVGERAVAPSWARMSVQWRWPKQERKCRSHDGRPCRSTKRSHAAVRTLHERPGQRRGVQSEALPPTPRRDGGGRVGRECRRNGGGQSRSESAADITREQQLLQCSGPKLMLRALPEVPKRCNGHA